MLLKCLCNNISIEKKYILKYLFSSSYVSTVNIVLVLVSLYFFVKLHFAKFKFAKLVADDIESNPGPDNSNSTLQYDTWYIKPECSEVDIQRNRQLQESL